MKRILLAIGLAAAGSRAGVSECVDLQVHAFEVVRLRINGWGQITVNTDGEVTGVSEA